MKNIVPVALVSIMLAVGFLFAQETEDPCKKANHDAMEDTNELLWIGAGCVSGLLFTPLAGLVPAGFGYFLTPKPREVNLVGKSPEYVDAYTSCYKNRRSMIQGNSAGVGCLCASAAWIVYGIIMLSTFSYY
ncbi:hypothetical protein JXM67_05435 [candidate division WOR-3 bacterium]|nr:hypothetical protein [candidate division WOR-3 bacterium]